ncbi:hypothetical protein [uncultured Aquimarina sp.]|uniref:hypothetical protein n=1 Tax=uncultured Aquimarina sp. TaxID=575652 RepID=UPI002637CE2B|nr:hypothetical protein [uncultured Aquimarina sp.]
MLFIKIKIAKFLIISGFLLNTCNYVGNLFDFYGGDSAAISYAIDDTEEKSESNEKDGSEKEDLKEKDKISQYADSKHTGISYYSIKYYPDLIYENLSVYLEYTTPPPELG